MLGLWWLALALLLGACGGEEDEDQGGDPASWRIVVTATAGTTGEVNGAVLPLTITAFQGNRPAPAGTGLEVLEGACLGQGTTLGTFQGQPAGPCAAISSSINTTSGSIQVNFQCTAPGTATILAAPVGVTTASGTVQLTCSPGPSGDWEVSALEVVEGNLVSGGGAVKIKATVLTGDGAAAPAGTRLEAVIANGDSLKFPNDRQTQAQTTDAQGFAFFNMVTTDKDGTTTIRVAFEDERFGQGTENAFPVRLPGDSTETTLQVTVRHEGQVLDIGERAVLADGEDQLDIEVVIIPPVGASFSVSNQEVSIKLLNELGYLGDDDDDTELELTTNDQGVVTTTYTGGTVADEVDIEITVANPDPNAESPTLRETLRIDVISLGSIEFVSATPDLLYVKGSGQNETSRVIFKILDTANRPLPGIRVRFGLNNPPAGTSLTNSEALSDEDGMVTTTISSGTTAGATGISASAELGDTVLRAPSSSLPIVGAKASRKGFDLLCEFRNVGAFIGRQGDQITHDHQYLCTSILQDRFGNPVGVKQNVTYFSEGGVIGSPKETVEWDFRVSPVPPANVGRVATDYNPRTRPPCDTDPIDGEPFFEYSEQQLGCSTPLNGCPPIETLNCTRNPRDGLVTIIAVASGEEEFEDSDGDGTYDDGEVFWDLGEPFIDANDNNEWDEGEIFQDLGNEDQPEGNGEYDGPNGIWDSLTSIWTSTRILLTDGPSVPTSPITGEPYEETIVYIVNGNVVEGSSATVRGLPANVTRVWFDENYNFLNASTVFTASSPNTTVALNQVGDGRVSDTYSFGVAQSRRVGDDPEGISRNYLTDVSFADFAPGNYHSVVVTLPPNSMLDPIIPISFKANYSFAPGVGAAGLREDIFTLTVRP